MCIFILYISQFFERDCKSGHHQKTLKKTFGLPKMIHQIVLAGNLANNLHTVKDMVYTLNLLQREFATEDFLIQLFNQTFYLIAPPLAISCVMALQ